MWGGKVRRKKPILRQNPSLRWRETETVTAGKTPNRSRSSHLAKQKPQWVSPLRRLISSFGAFLFSAFYLLPAGPVVRNSANSVELLIFVTTQGSGPSVADGCSMLPRPTGVGPKAIE